MPTSELLARKSKMEKQIMKGVRLPLPLVRRIERTTKAEGSTFSQFMRTAAIRELNSRERGAV